MPVGALLREWRAARHFSQLDLALSAGISARHLSCIETGKARPGRELLARLADALEMPLRERNALLAQLAKLGPLSRIVGATIRDTANPTMLNAGYKANVIPSTAEAVVDCRVLPGRQEAFLREVDELLGPHVTRSWVTDLPPVETEFGGPLTDAMAAALRTEDPTAETVPYMLSGGTDAKAFAELGMACFGFAPLRLPADLDFASLFHGIDERVPVDALEFGTRVLDTFLRTC